MSGVHSYVAGPAAPSAIGPGSYFSSVLLSFLGGLVLSFCFQRYSPRTAARVGSAAAALAKEREPMKMTLVVRKDLKMTTGKIAAQCAHAAVAVVDDVHDKRHELATRPDPASPANAWPGWLDAWQATGSMKVALRCETEAQLLAVHQAALKAGLPTYVIMDAGRTQIEAGSKTVVAVGPAPVSKVDSVTGELKLL